MSSQRYRAVPECILWMEIGGGGPSLLDPRHWWAAWAWICHLWLGLCLPFSLYLSITPSVLPPTISLPSRCSSSSSSSSSSLRVVSQRVSLCSTNPPSETPGSSLSIPTLTPLKPTAGKEKTPIFSSISSLPPPPLCIISHLLVRNGEKRAALKGSNSKQQCCEYATASSTSLYAYLSPSLSNTCSSCLLLPFAALTSKCTHLSQVSLSFPVRRDNYETTACL